jgi:very-short-patch-repair endonuclease
MPSIYLAGKIGPNDWRHDLTGWQLRHAWEVDDAHPDEPWPVMKRSILGVFDYVGPYFVSDDHGCGHGSNTHGCGNDGVVPCFTYENLPKRDRVRELCLSAIDTADIVFAWLDDLTAYGTLVEIGYARGRGKIIVIAAPEAPRTFGWSSNADEVVLGIADSATNDLWFAFSCASTIITAETPHEAVKEVARLFPALESPIEQAFWDAYVQKLPRELSGLEAQHAVLGGRYRIDFALPKQKIGIELDGYAWHSSPEAFTRDRARQRELELEGWRIIRFSGSEVTKDADDCVTQAATYAARLGRD